MDAATKLKLALQEGESLHVEFKEGVDKNLDKEIVAFANTSGGSIYIGINDDNKIIGIDATNKIKSQIRDIAHNCDPRIAIELIIHKEVSVIEVVVAEGEDKPYRCRTGFYLRQGDESTKLKRDEIVSFIRAEGLIRFDEAVNKYFRYPDDFSETYFDDYLSIAGISKDFVREDLLCSLGVAVDNNQLQFTNAGLLLFAKNPQQFLPESYITAVLYKSTDKHTILDKKEIKGSLIEQIDEAINFVMRHSSMSIEIGASSSSSQGRRQETYDYPKAAVREAVVNAVVHRDYFYDSSHTYIHMYSDRIDFENPGGLFRDMTPKMVLQRSIRRNRLLADLLHRAKYIEGIGSGYARIESELKRNNNPPFEISATNFFNLIFYKRLNKAAKLDLTDRQRKLLHFITQQDNISSQSAALYLDVSNDTALRELRQLLKVGLIERQGVGKATVYRST